MKAKAIITMMMVSAAVYAQETMPIETIYPVTSDYNRWSMDAQFGLNYAEGPMSPGYNTNRYGLYHVALGTRYMFNPKVGLRLSIGYDQLTEGFNTPDFHTDYFRSSIEGVVNLARLLDFNTRFGMLLHGGGGYSLMTGVNMTEDYDHIMNFTMGITPQYMLSDRWSVYGDVAAVANVYQDFNYDFVRRHDSRGFDGILYNFSVGLQYNFGDKDKRYADFIYGDPELDALSRELILMQGDLNTVQRELEGVERNLVDSDNDGVANYLDQEANTPEGVLVDTKGRGIVWYSVYQELDEFDNNVTTDWTGYLNRNQILFETEQYTIDPVYNRTLNNMAVVLINNPAYTVSVIGHADDRGEAPFNLELSKKRADAVKDYLVAKGIDANRITASGVGEVQPEVQVNVKAERQHNRRVQFMVSTK